jgi:hypothetical protein
MSLNWSLAKMKNVEELCWEPDLSANGTGTKMTAITETLIFGTMTTGINSITKDNFAEFHRRLLETAIVLLDGDGLLSYYDGAKTTHRNPTLKEVHDHIGLSTNADTKTKAQWKATLMRYIESRSKQEQWADKSQKPEEVNA